MRKPLEIRKSERLANIAPEFNYTDLPDEVRFLLNLLSVVKAEYFQDFVRRKKLSFEDIDDLEKPIFRSAKRIRLSKRASIVPCVPVEEITEDYLNKIAVSSAAKIYDPVSGTSCHQCRQKTRDSKTYCRSGKCVGK